MKNLKSILFIDEVCPKPYDTPTLTLKPQGGTETTVTRVALGLAMTERWNVYVEQHGRQECQINYPPAHFLPIGYAPKAEIVVCLRTPHTIEYARNRFPTAKIFLWSHDLATPNLTQELCSVLKAKISANVVVSQFHKNQTLEVLNRGSFPGGLKHEIVYNPIPDTLEPTRETVDTNKLVWLSSPHKGVKDALRLFRLIRAHNPGFHFYVANPGYYQEELGTEEGVTNLGAIPWQDGMKVLSNALCLFYPNKVFPETFGLVAAEANALGVPVLTHDLGAMREVLDRHPDQIHDCRNDEEVIKTILKWHQGGFYRPRVLGRPEFRLKAVIRRWEDLFNRALASS